MPNIPPSAKPNIAISEERVKELRKYVWDSHRLESDTAFRHDLLSILDDYSALKAENERLREENGVFDSELGRLRMENEKWCAREEKK